jgi:hypothetical protein
MNFNKKTKILFVHKYMIFALLAGKSLLDFATLTEGGSLYELDAAVTPKAFVSSYFVTSGRLLFEGFRAFQSWILCCFQSKMSPKMLFFQDKCLNKMINGR